MSGIRIVLVSLPCVLYQGKLTAGAKQPKLLLQTIKIFRKVRVAPFFFFAPMLFSNNSMSLECLWYGLGLSFSFFVPLLIGYFAIQYTEAEST